MTYDSTLDTVKHINKVKNIISLFIGELTKRAKFHDLSKLESPEKEIFDKYYPKLSATTYGSKEYENNLKEMKVALDHHYKNNSHHPEYYKNGIDGMDLFDLMEMTADWKVSIEKHDDGDIMNSLKINKERFQISDQLYNILKNTINRLKLQNESVEDK